jgi:hypothetical protein
MDMNTPLRIRARSRADRRLQAMTIGTAMLGVVATGAFGYAAAVSYTGKTTTALADDQQAAGDPNAGVGDPNAGVPNANGAAPVDPNPGVANPNTGVANPTPGTTTQQAPAPTVRRTHKTGHVSTGGS